MSVYIIEPDEIGALEKVAPRLSAAEADAVAAARLVRVEVDTVRRAWRVILEGDVVIAESTLRKLEQRLLDSVTGVDDVQFVFASTAGASEGRGDRTDQARDVGVTDTVAVPGQADTSSSADVPPTDAPPTDVPPLDEPPPFGEPPPADEYDDDDYLDRILKNAANGLPLAPVAGHEGRERRSNGRDSSLLVARIDGEPTPLRDVNAPQREIIVEGEVLTCEMREVRGGYLLTFDLTDMTDSITVKAFARGEAPDKPPVQVGGAVRVRGRVELDRFTQELVITPSAVAEVALRRRTDDYPEKRVELHLHTKMSSLDGAADTKAIIRQAAEWGHKAVAVTDHGVVHAFPEAYQTAKAAGIKLIFGVEGYLVNDGDERGRSYHIVILAANKTGQIGRAHV